MKKIDVSNVDSIYIDDKQESNPSSKTKSVRISLKNANRIKALSDAMQFDTIDHTLDKIIDQFESELRGEQREDYISVLTILDRKSFRK